MVYCNIGAENKDGIRKVIYWVEDNWTSLDRKELWEKYDITFKDGIAIMCLTDDAIAIGKEENGEITFYFNSRKNEYQHSSKIEYFETFVSLFKTFKEQLKERK